MDKDEALCMALGALEFYYDLYKEKVDANVITAIKAALAQPERTWVGLTKEDIFLVLGSLQAMYNRPPTEDSRVVFALAIEAKLREKNGG